MSTSKSKLSVIIVVLWITSVVLAMWLFFYAHYRDFPLPSDALVIEQFSEPELAGGISMVHFIDPNCSCNRYSLPHIQSLKTKWPQIRHFELYSHEDPNDEWLQPLQHVVRGYPSVALIDETGRLLYYGTYTSGFQCGEGEDHLEPFINANAIDPPRQWINVLGFGCFCESNYSPSPAG